MGKHNTYKYYNKHYSKRKKYRLSYEKQGGLFFGIAKLFAFLFIGIIKAIIWVVQQIIKLFNKPKQPISPINKDSSLSFVDIEVATQVNESTSSPADDFDKFKYESKQLLSQCEVKYMTAIKEVLNEINPDYILTPQVNLASIIKRKTKYANELFRNLDFGVFDKSYKIVVAIEINDKTHNQQERRSRDKKVSAILAEANIPLITFWTKYGINKDYIRAKLSEFCFPKTQE